MSFEAMEDPDPDWKEDADPFDKRDEFDDNSAAEKGWYGTFEYDVADDDAGAPCLPSPATHGIDG
jgi:hypothetical protein